MDIIPQLSPRVDIQGAFSEKLGPTIVPEIEIPENKSVLLVKDAVGEESVPVVVRKGSEDVETVLEGMYPDGITTETQTQPHIKMINFLYCKSVLKMPTEYASFLAFGTNYILDSQYFPIPDNDTKTSLTVAMRGESAKEKGGKGVGKSTLSAVLATRLEKSGLSVAVFDFESFYEEGAGMYSKILRESNWDGTYDQAVKLINEFVWHGGQQKKPGRLKSVREIMEGDKTGQGAKFFRDNATRPDIIIYDISGMPGKLRDDLGAIKRTRRPYNAHALMGLGADVVFHTDRPVLTKSKYSKVEPIERKLAFFKKIVEDKLEERQNGN